MMTRTVTRILHASRKAQLLPATRNIPGRALTVILQANPAPQRVSLCQPYLDCAWSNKANLPCFSLLLWVEPGILNLFKSIKREAWLSLCCEAVHLLCVEHQQQLYPWGYPCALLPFRKCKKKCVTMVFLTLTLVAASYSTRYAFVQEGGFLLFDPCT